MINKELVLTINRVSNYLWSKDLDVLTLPIEVIYNKNEGNAIVCFQEDLNTAIDTVIKNKLETPILVFEVPGNIVSSNNISGIKYLKIPVNIDKIISEFNIAKEHIKYTQKFTNYPHYCYLAKMKNAH